MRYFVFTYIILWISISVKAQQFVEGEILIDQKARAYVMYIPASYSEARPLPLLLSLHPFDTYQWDAFAWASTLSEWAEQNQVVLLCPDAGEDGHFDHVEDYVYLDRLMDEVKHVYHTSSNYCMGVSWGAKSALQYGLSRSEQFAGFLLVASTLESHASIASLLPRAEGKAVYMIHGSVDVPTRRFYPLRDSLILSGACVETVLLPGQGHSFEFPHRDLILGKAFTWLHKTNCHQENVLYAQLTHAPKTYVRQRIHPFVNLDKLYFRGLGPHQEVDEIWIYNQRGDLEYHQVSVNSGAPLPLLRRGEYILTYAWRGKRNSRAIYIP